MIRAVVVALVATATLAFADPDAAFRAAGELAARNDPRALEAYEALGAERPISIWTDDAWVEAARIAERNRDFDRARKNFENAIAISQDAQLLRRAKRDLERVLELTGGGEWTAVAAEHQRLVTAINAGGDPQDELAELEQLAKKHPAYPRGVQMRIAIARGWETEDEIDRALDWLRDAIRATSEPGSAALSIEQERARVELIRMTLRARELDEARHHVPLVRDAATRASLQRKVATAELQQLVRWIVAGALAVLIGIAVFLVRRRSDSWRAALRLFAKPPIEVIYFVPIAAVVAIISTTGNPLVATAVIWIGIGAAIVAWISGVTLEAAKRRGRIGARHAILHAAIVGIAALMAAYLAVDHARLVDLVAETWRTGPGH